MVGTGSGEAHVIPGEDFGKGVELVQHKVTVDDHGTGNETRPEHIREVFLPNANISKPARRRSRAMKSGHHIHDASPRVSLPVKARLHPGCRAELGIVKVLFLDCTCPHLLTSPL